MVYVHKGTLLSPERECHFRTVDETGHHHGKQTKPVWRAGLYIQDPSKKKNVADNPVSLHFLLKSEFKRTLDSLADSFTFSFQFQNRLLKNFGTEAAAQQKNTCLACVRPWFHPNDKTNKQTHICLCLILSCISNVHLGIVLDFRVIKTFQEPLFYFKPTFPPPCSLPTQL